MIIGQPRSVIPACDVDARRYELLVESTSDLSGVGGYKLGFVLALSIGLPRAVEIARRYTDKPLIYDHQKAATDIPDTGRGFAAVCKKSGVDAVILFPQAGPETGKAWIEASREEGLGVIVGGLMTHRRYVRSDGGYIADEAVVDIYEMAAGLGVADYIVPGTSPEAIKKIREMLERRGVEPVFYSPGFISQGGRISNAASAAGGKYHIIVGRGIYSAKDMRAAAERLCSQLVDVGRGT